MKVGYKEKVSEERFRKLMDCDFSFEQRFGDDKVEERLARLYLGIKEQSVGGTNVSRSQPYNPKKSSYEDTSQT